MLNVYLSNVTETLHAEITNYQVTEESPSDNHFHNNINVNIENDGELNDSDSLDNFINHEDLNESDSSLDEKKGNDTSSGSFNNNLTNVPSQNITVPSDHDSSGSEYFPPDHSDSEDGSDGKDRCPLNGTQAYHAKNSTFTVPNSSAECSFNSSMNRASSAACIDDDLVVKPSQVAKDKGKQHFCLYCKKLQSKIALHLERAHSDIPDVRKFTLLPKKIMNEQK